VELKDSENDQLNQCLEALKKELSAVSDELRRFSGRSSLLEQGRRVTTIFSSIIKEQGRDGSRSSSRASKSPSSGQLPRITDTSSRSSLSGSKKLA